MKQLQTELADAIIEEQNEPNLHEWDIQEDNRRRYENMTGGI